MLPKWISSNPKIQSTNPDAVTIILEKQKNISHTKIMIGTKIPNLFLPFKVQLKPGMVMENINLMVFFMARGFRFRDCPEHNI